MRYTVLEAKGNIPIIGEERRPVYELTPKPVTVGVYPPPPKPDASEFTRLLSDLSEIVSLIQRDVEEQHIRVCSFGQAYIRWRDLNQARIQDGKGLFLLETLYAFLANLLLARICQEVFDDVLQGVMILALERYPAGGKPAATHTTISEAYSLAELSDQPRKTSVPTDRVLLRKNGQLYFIFKADGRAHDLIARFFAQGYALSSPQIGYKTRTGPIVWNRVKDSLRDSPAARCLPLIWSNNVSRYGFAFEGNRFGRQAWALRGPKTESFKISQPVILVQRTTAREQPRRPVAAYPTAFFAAHSEFFVENHLNAVAPVRGSSEVVPEYVLALLNSTLYDFAFRCLNGNTQVSASELDTFPVVLTAGQSLFIEKVQKIVSAQTTDTRAQVESEIDQMVFDLFGLTQSERGFVLSHYPGQQT